MVYFVKGRIKNNQDQISKPPSYFHRLLLCIYPPTYKHFFFNEPFHIKTEIVMQAWHQIIFCHCNKLDKVMLKQSRFNKLIRTFHADKSPVFFHLFKIHIKLSLFFLLLTLMVISNFISFLELTTYQFRNCLRKFPEIFSIILIIIYSV